MFVPAVTTDSPPGFTEPAADVAQPPLGSGSGSTFTQWLATRSPTTKDTLLLGCVATPIPGWVEDMRPTVDARTVALMDASVERVVGVPVEARDASGHFSLRPVGAPEDAPRLGIARTFVGFTDHEVVTCFAACANARTKSVEHPGAPRACDASVLSARLDGGSPPPAAGVVLGAVTWAVHHPRTAVTWGSVLAFALGAVAVASRRRPRSRI
jgi:hypothetical protein